MTMKIIIKLIVVLFIILVLTSCIKDIEQRRQSITHDNFVEELQVQRYRVFRIEGCQYIWLTGSGGFSHKGNCDNPIHIYNTSDHHE
jgi:uncharacterized alpha/beta hydrolase family protein